MKNYRLGFALFVVGTLLNTGDAFSEDSCVLNGALDARTNHDLIQMTDKQIIPDNDDKHSCANWANPPIPTSELDLSGLKNFLNYPSTPTSFNGCIPAMVAKPADMSLGEFSLRRTICANGTKEPAKVNQLVADKMKSFSHDNAEMIKNQESFLADVPKKAAAFKKDWEKQHPNQKCAVVYPFMVADKDPISTIMPVADTKSTAFTGTTSDDQDQQFSEWLKKNPSNQSTYDLLSDNLKNAYKRNTLWLLKSINNSKKDLRVCDSPVLDPAKIPSSEGMALQRQPVVIDVIDHRASNQWDYLPQGSSDADRARVKAIADGIQNNQVVKDNLSCGRKIKSMIVDASSSALGNTGEAGRIFGKWGMKGLSDQRATSFVNKVLSQVVLENTNDDGSVDTVFNGPVDHSDPKKVWTSTDGDNGVKDGTSGPCPYEVNKYNGRDVVELKKKYQDMYDKGTLTKEFEKYQKVNLVVVFDDSGDPLCEKKDPNKPLVEKDENGKPIKRPVQEHRNLATSVCYSTAFTCNAK